MNKSDENFSKENKDNKENKESPFQCIICLETAKEPVVTKCGHLFCWPCIYDVYIYIN